MRRGIGWAVEDVAQLRQRLEEGRRARAIRAMRPDWPMDSIKTKLKQLRRGATDESPPQAANDGSFGRDRSGRERDAA